MRNAINSRTHPWRPPGTAPCTSAQAASPEQNPPVRWCTARWNRSRSHPRTTRTSPPRWTRPPAQQRRATTPEPPAAQSGRWWPDEAPSPNGAGGWRERGPAGTWASGRRRWAPAWWRGRRSEHRGWRRLSQCRTEEWCDHNLEIDEEDGRRY